MNKKEIMVTTDPGSSDTKTFYEVEGLDTSFKNLLKMEPEILTLPDDAAEICFDEELGNGKPEDFAWVREKKTIPL